MGWWFGNPSPYARRAMTAHQHSLSKRSSLPGLRIGFTAGDKSFIKPFLDLRTVAAPQVPVPAQEVAIAAYADEAHVEENRALYESDVLEPMIALLDDLTTLFAKKRVPLKADGKRSMFRLNRDVRSRRPRRQPPFLPPLQGSEALRHPGPSHHWTTLSNTRIGRKSPVDNRMPED